MAAAFEHTASWSLSSGFAPSGLVWRVFSECISTGRACEEFGGLKEKVCIQTSECFCEQTSVAGVWCELECLWEKFNADAFRKDCVSRKEVQ